MPIQIGSDGETIVALGHGDVMISVTSEKGSDTDRFVVFRQLQETHDVGSSLPNDYISPEGEDVVIEFTNIAALDCLIRSLKSIRESMMEAQEGSPILAYTGPTR